MVSCSACLCARAVVELERHEILVMRPVMGRADAVCGGRRSYRYVFWRGLGRRRARRAGAARQAAARHAALAAAALPDPKLVLGLDNLPVRGDDKWSLSRDFMTMQRVGVSQDLPNAGKRKARIAQANAVTADAELATRSPRLKVRRETAAAWLAAYFGAARRVLLDALVKENGVFERSIAARHAAGTASASDVLLPKREALTETATDPAPLEMFETTLTLKPRSEWRAGMTVDTLAAELDRLVQVPGLSNLWVAPIRTRIDMLATGIKSPIGVKVAASDLATIDKVSAAVVQTARWSAACGISTCSTSISPSRPPSAVSRRPVSPPNSAW